MENLTLLLSERINITLFLIIILGGIFITKYTKDFTKIGNVYKVLIASVIFSIVFYLLEDEKPDNLTNYLLTYLIATSFYEVFVKWVIGKIAPKKKNYNE